MSTHSLVCVELYLGYSTQSPLVSCRFIRLLRGLDVEALGRLPLGEPAGGADSAHLALPSDGTVELVRAGGVKVLVQPHGEGRWFLSE